MGRPLNKRYFGDPALDGQQLLVEADLGNGPVTGWIIRQKGTRLYDITDGVDTLRCRLVEEITKPGDAKISVIPFSGPNENARTLQAHRVKTWEGNDVVWRLTAPVDETTVTVPNA